MTKAGACTYAYFRAAGLPAGPFGETYVIATAIDGANAIRRYEFFVVSKRHEPHLIEHAVEFPPGSIPDELLAEDKDFLLNFATQEAENYLLEALYKLADQHGEHILLNYRVELVEMKSIPLLSLWMRDELHDEIRTVYEKTKCPSLKLSVGLVMGSGVLRRPAK
jgi:hypothetical protein